MAYTKETTASFTFAETPRENQQQVNMSVWSVGNILEWINCFSAFAVPIDIVGIVPVLWYLHLAPVCPLWWGSGEGRVISDTLICLWCSVGCSVDSRLCRGDLNIHHIYQKDTLVHVESAAKVVRPRQLPTRLWYFRIQAEDHHQCICLPLFLARMWCDDCTIWWIIAHHDLRSSTKHGLITLKHLTTFFIAK